MVERDVIDPTELEAARGAGEAAARYCRIDPAFYVERAGMAGVQFVLTERHGFGTCFLDADMVEATFLDSWLNACAGAAAEVEALLRRRGLIAI
jgi:hypothetical protein